MAVVKPFVFQIVGYQNSGKTTIVKKLISDLAKEQISVVTMKHHGHGGKPIIAEEKDSSQHIGAGALASLVEGGGRLILHAEKREWKIEEQIQLLSQLHTDIILIEGHKFAEYPKGVIVRRQEDVELLSMLENIQVIYYWDRSLVKSVDISSFHIDDPAGYRYAVNLLKRKTSG